MWWDRYAKQVVQRETKRQEMRRLKKEKNGLLVRVKRREELKAIL